MRRLLLNVVLPVAVVCAVIVAVSIILDRYVVDLDRIVGGEE